MKITKTDFKGLFIIEPDVFCDDRGWFTESYNKMNFSNDGIQYNFIQDNHSLSRNKGVLRGFHFQINPKAQTKLVRCTRGSILDAVVDLRKGSDTYKQVFTIELTEENKKQLLIPKGFGHAFETLSDNTEVQYKVDEYYSKECERTLKYDDPEFLMNWQAKEPILSNKDASAKYLKDIDINFSIKVLVTGAKGQLGSDLVRLLSETGIDTLGIDSEDCDITNRIDLEKKVTTYQPDIIIHSAAYTKVDEAEDQKEKCYSINVDGTKNLVELSKMIDAKFILISSDYVFDGEKDGFYSEEDKINPINIYGKTKADAEKIVEVNLESYYIIRTSWLYGLHSNNFVKNIVKLAKTKEELSVVNDQIGSPTYSYDLAKSILEIMQTKKFGIYHVTNEGYCSWYEFAKEIYDQLNIATTLLPIKSNDYCVKALRPKNSRLSKDKMFNNGFTRLPDWKDAIRRYLDILNTEK